MIATASVAMPRAAAKGVMLALMLVVAGCGPSSPLPRTFVLSAPADPVPRENSETGKPILAVERVSLPDYLDSSSIQLRDGQNELIVSSTGRWGERLSVGVTDALASDLQRRLPGVLVIPGAASGQPARRLAVDIEAFDVRTDRNCVLRTRWSMSGDDGRAAVAPRRDTLVTRVAGSGTAMADADVANAMAAAIGQLADKIAAATSRSR